MNALRVAIAKVRWSLNHRGVFGTLKTATGRLASKKNETSAQEPHPFDTQHGVDTSGLLTAVALASGNPNDLLGTGYSGTPPSRFRAVTEHWIAAPPERPTPAYSFIDIGSGKGRAMMLATDYPFAEIIGVEMNAGLAQVARDNLEKWQASNPSRSPTRVVCQDALQFEFPTTPCLVYLYNPFAEPILKQLIERLGVEKATPRGSAGLKATDVASGRADFYLHPTQAGKRWDTCAPEAIVTAAGGVCTDALGNTIDYGGPELANTKGFLASNGKLHQAVLDIVRQRGQ